jgi:hypothetical protein
VGNKIADKICRMREEGVQFTRDNLINIPYLAHSPELFEMIDYTTMVSDTPCITEIFDQYLRNYYSALVLKPKVYKPESFQGLTQVVMKHRVCTMRTLNQKRVVAGELSQGQVGDIRLQQGTYVVSSAPVQSGISTVCPGVDHVTSNPSHFRD